MLRRHFLPTNSLLVALLAVLFIAIAIGLPSCDGQAFFGSIVMMLVLVFFSAQKPDPFRSVNDGSVHQQIVQKVFQTCAGDDDCLSGLSGLYLADIQRVVVQAADLLGHQAGHGDGGPGAQPGGELPDGQGGRGDPAVPS